MPQGNGEIGEVSVRFRDAASKEMVERTWTISYDAQASAFDRATPSMQLAGLSLLAAEKLKGGPLGRCRRFQTIHRPASHGETILRQQSPCRRHAPSNRKIEVGPRPGPAAGCCALSSASLLARDRQQARIQSGSRLDAVQVANLPNIYPSDPATVIENQLSENRTMNPPALRKSNITPFLLLALFLSLHVVKADDKMPWNKPLPKKEAVREDKRDLLSSHDTEARFTGLTDHQCMGRTSNCPDRCGDSGKLATFTIVKYLAYEKPGEYGDPKQEQFRVLIEDNLKNPKVPVAIRDAILALKPGDLVHLKWNHDYVTKDGSKFPERPITEISVIKDK